MSPFRILVADDHELTRKAVRALLEAEANQQVIGEAATGLETIGQVASLDPDLVILDLAMPELNGLEVAARLRQTHPETRMILLTANATPALERQALAIGIYRCISKGSAPRELTEAVTSLRGNRGHIESLLVPRLAESENNAAIISAPQAKTQSAPEALTPIAESAPVAMSLDSAGEPNDKLQ